MIDKEHPPSIRVLIDVVRATGLSAPKALVFDSSDPFPGSAISGGVMSILPDDPERDGGLLQGLWILFRDRLAVFS